MNNYKKVKELNIGKKKSFRILLMAEIVLFLMGILGCFRENAVYEYDIEQVRVNSGKEGYLVEVADIVLPKGVYQVQLHYNTDRDMVHLCTAEDASGAMGNVYCNGAGLFSGLDHTDFTMWVCRKSAQVAVRVRYGGEGEVAVQGLTIKGTHAGDRIFLFKLLCLSLAVNVIYLYIQYDRTYGIPRKSKAITFCLGITILMASFPVTVNYIFRPGDRLLFGSPGCWISPGRGQHRAHDLS